MHLRLTLVLTRVVSRRLVASWLCSTSSSLTLSAQSRSPPRQRRQATGSLLSSSVPQTSIASKETGKSQAESDLKSTDAKIVEDMDDLDKHQNMLDDVLKELEDLKPACVDTGMSYADRVQKRKDEIDALKKALCELDPEKVEDECK